MDNIEQQPTLFVGLDIGTTKVCVIIAAEGSSERLNVLGVGNAESEGLSRGVITNIEKTVRSIQTAVEIAEQQAGVRIHSVYVGTAGEHIQSLQSRGVIAITNPEHEISEEDVKRLLQDTKRISLPAEREILHVFPQEYVIDGQTGFHDPIGMTGIRLEATVHVVTGVIGALRNIKKCVERTHLRVDDIILQPLASSEAVLIDKEKELGVALIDIGGGTTDIIIFDEGVIRHSASIPYAGNHVTQDIRKGLGILQEQAETIKKDYGCTFIKNILENEFITIPGVAGRSPLELSKETLCGIIQPRMEEIFELVAEEIRRSGYSKQLSGGIVLTGGGSMIRGTVELAQAVLGVPAKLGIPSGFSGGLVKEIEHPLYATCAGLTLLAYHQREEKYNADELYEHKKNSTPFTKMVNWLKNM
ncbi:MAG: cell division protein FtsA [Bacteroidota bacterium]